MVLLEESHVVTKLFICVSNEDFITLKSLHNLKLIRGRWANLSLNISWHAYLNSEKIFRNKKKWISALFDLVKFTAKLLFIRSFRVKEKKSFVRHQNISLSHLSVFSDSMQNNCDWALILEDDVCDETFDSQVLKVFEYIKENDFSQCDLFINLSESLTYKQLGVSEIVKESKLNDTNPDFWMTTKTFHNTTAANLYNKRFIMRFNSDFQQEIHWCIRRAIPFDWILNYLVLQDVGKDIRSIHMTKPIFRQLSISYKID